MCIRDRRERERDNEGRVENHILSIIIIIITREEEEEHIFEFGVKNLGIPPSVASRRPDEARKSITVQKS